MWLNCYAFCWDNHGKSHRRTLQELNSENFNLMRGIITSTSQFMVSLLTFIHLQLLLSKVTFVIDFCVYSCRLSFRSSVLLTISKTSVILCWNAVYLFSKWAIFCRLRWRGWWRDWRGDRWQPTEARTPFKPPDTSNNHGERRSIWTVPQALPRVPASAAAQLRCPFTWHGPRGWLRWGGVHQQTAVSWAAVSALLARHLGLWGLKRTAS